MPSQKKVHHEDCVDILCLNAFIRPPGIHSGERLFGHGDYKDFRLQKIKDKIKDVDLVLLQEMFAVGGRQSDLISAAQSHGLIYNSGSVWPTIKTHQIIDGGLLILSRYPVIERDQYRFSRHTGADSICSKGVLYTRIQLSTDLLHGFHVFTTHLQSGESQHATDIRLSQVKELSSYIQSKVKLAPHLPVLIAGDFNLDARHNYVHPENDAHARPTHHRCAESQNYLYLFQLLEEACEAHDVENVIKTHAAKDQEPHPVTNGIGHGLLHSKVDDAHSDIAKCIDFMFLAQPKSVSNMTLDVLPEHTGIDRCRVVETQDDGKPRPNFCPPTTLSDHFGLRSRIRFKLSNIPEWTTPQNNGPASSYQDMLHHHLPPMRLGTLDIVVGRTKLTLTLLMLMGLVSLSLWILTTSLWG